MVLIDVSSVDEDGLGMVVRDVDDSERLESTVYIPCSSSTSIGSPVGKRLLGVKSLVRRVVLGAAGDGLEEMV
jgi:hypothetical protein